MSAADCKLKLKPRLGSLGPCVKKPAAPAAEASKPTETKPAEDTPAEPAQEAEPEAAAADEKQEEAPATAE